MNLIGTSTSYWLSRVDILFDVVPLVTPVTHRKKVRVRKRKEKDRCLVTGREQWMEKKKLHSSIESYSED